MAEELHAYHKKYFFNSLSLSYSSDLLSQDIEEIIVKGTWREANVLQESSSIVFSIQNYSSLSQ